MEASSQRDRRVAAIAGRRIDKPGSSPPRFPAASEEAVKAALKRFLSVHGVNVVVASAACGSDILALEAARELGIRTRIILPSARSRFRKTSVVDRGEEWGRRYDVLIEDADERCDLVELGGGDGNDDAAYAAATTAIVAEAAALSQEEFEPLALVVWEGIPRESGDATKEFLEEASRAGFDCHTIATVAAE